MVLYVSSFQRNYWDFLHTKIYSCKRLKVV